MSKSPTETRDRAAAMKAKGAKHTDIAEALDISRRTVTRWVAEPEFQLRVAAHREGLTEVGRLATAELALEVPAIVRAYINLVTSEDVSPDTRLNGMQWLLDRFAPAAPQRPADGAGRSPLHLHVTQALSAAPGEREAHLVEARTVARQLVADAYGLSAPVDLPAGMDDRPVTDAEVE